MAVTEISGSESFVHVDIGLGTWVGLIEGLHEWQPGDATEIQFDPSRAFVFDADGRRVTAPGLAATA